MDNNVLAVFCQTNRVLSVDNTWSQNRDCIGPTEVIMSSMSAKTGTSGQRFGAHF